MDLSVFEEKDVNTVQARANLDQIAFLVQALVASDCGKIACLRTGIGRGTAAAAHDAHLIIFQEVPPRSIPAGKTARFPMQLGDKYLTKFHGLLVVTILDLQLWICLNE